MFHFFYDFYFNRIDSRYYIYKSINNIKLKVLEGDYIYYTMKSFMIYIFTSQIYMNWKYIDINNFNRILIYCYEKYFNGDEKFKYWLV